MVIYHPLPKFFDVFARRLLGCHLTKHHFCLAALRRFLQKMLIWIFPFRPLMPHGGRNSQ